MIMPGLPFGLFGVAPISYVGGNAFGGAGFSALTFSLTGLSGGSDAAPKSGDLVVAFAAIASDISASPTASVTGYTNLSQVVASDDRKTTLVAAYKFMGPIPDTEISHASPGLGASLGLAVHVFRNVNASNPLAVASVSASGINTAVANPAAISGLPKGSWVIAGAGGAHTSGSSARYTSSDLSGFVSNSGNSSFDATIGAGYVASPGSSFAPAAFGVSGITASNENSWASYTLALRPK